jgi:hypothetical protein
MEYLHHHPGRVHRVGEGTMIGTTHDTNGSMNEANVTGTGIRLESGEGIAHGNQAGEDVINSQSEFQ